MHCTAPNMFSSKHFCYCSSKNPQMPTSRWHPVNTHLPRLDHYALFQKHRHGRRTGNGTIIPFYLFFRLKIDEPMPQVAPLEETAFSGG